MRIEAKLLELGGTLNDFKIASQVTIAQGENPTLLFQFVDINNNNLRYIPSAGATVQVEIARFPEVFASISNVRSINDYSVRQAATNPFPLDTSIWSTPLSAVQTSTMMSSNIRVTLTEGANVKVSLIIQALVIIPSEGQP